MCIRDRAVAARAVGTTGAVAARAVATTRIVATGAVRTARAVAAFTVVRPARGAGGGLALLVALGVLLAFDVVLGALVLGDQAGTGAGAHALGRGFGMRVARGFLCLLYTSSVTLPMMSALSAT